MHETYVEEAYILMLTVFEIFMSVWPGGLRVVETVKIIS